MTKASRTGLKILGIIALLFVMAFFRIVFNAMEDSNGASMSKADIKDAVENANANLPQKVNDGIVGESIMYKDGTIEMTYILTNLTNDQINQDKLETMAQQMGTQNICQHEYMRSIVDSGVPHKQYWLDKNRMVLHVETLTAVECNQRDQQANPQDS